ncbi:MAG: plasmid pRiA4b ORF-3 family protein [Acidimicrobiales bacterium]|nr:plasmid pRiA4b ORF-3 family protein [Acidimicrobiales bacterium]
MLVVRGTKKLRDRVKGPVAAADEVSATALGDWFATALFWKPQVALLVNQRTFLPVFMELAPAATLLDRIPAAVEAALRRQGVDEAFIATERAAMGEVRIAPTNDRSVVGVMTEFGLHAGWAREKRPTDLDDLSRRLATMLLGPLMKGDGPGSPDRALAALVGGAGPLAEVISLRPDLGDQAPAPSGPLTGAARGDVFQLKVTLLGIKPPVWRRVLVDGASTLDQVHEVIQAAFGWWNYHLHEFEVGDDRYGVPDEDYNPEYDFGPPTIDEGLVRLDSVAGEGSKFDYAYDFGDDWRHRIVVEKVLPADGGAPVTVPACVDGRRACPPEDCGGPWGYEELLAILADPSHPEHTERLEWLGRPFDPDAFEAGDFETNLRNQQLTAFDDWH